MSSYTKLILATAGLVSYWPLNEAPGATTAINLGPSGNNGTYKGAVTLGQAGPGDGETAPLFGASGYVDCGSSSAYNLVNGPLSIEGLINAPIGNANSQAILSNSGSSYYLRMGGSSTYLLTLLRSFVGNNAVSTKGLTPQQWYHCVATKTGPTTVHLYINGVDVTGTVTSQTDAAPQTTLKLGADSGNSGGLVTQDYVNGQLARCALYNVVLSPATVAAHYHMMTTVGILPLLPGA